MSGAKETEILKIATYTNIRVVAMVLIAIMCVTTFMTQKQIAKRSGPVEGQAATVQKLMLYGVPLSLLVSGFIFPIGVLIYWVTNNAWTFGQQFFILRKMPPPGSPAALARAAEDKPAVESRTLAPKPGAKPVRTKPASRRPRRPPGADAAAGQRLRRHRRRRRHSDGTAAGRAGEPRSSPASSAEQGQAQAAMNSGAGGRHRGPDACRRHRHRPPGTPEHRIDLGGPPMSAPQQPDRYDRDGGDHLRRRAEPGARRGHRHRPRTCPTPTPPVTTPSSTT